MKLKKVLAATLAAAMVMSSSLMVSAKSSPSSEGGSSVTVAEPAAVKAAGAAMSVAGVSMKTSVAGMYAANSVQGAVVVTPLAEVKAALGLTGSQVPAITLYDTVPTKSPRALASLNAAADAYGVTITTILDINLGARENGKWVTLKDGSVAMTAGLPKGADTTKTYSAILVQPGGAITILEDQDTDPKTITFEVKAGTGAYAIVAK